MSDEISPQIWLPERNVLPKLYPTQKLVLVKCLCWRSSYTDIGGRWVGAWNGSVCLQEAEGEDVCMVGGCISMHKHA